MTPYICRGKNQMLIDFSSEIMEARKKKHSVFSRVKKNLQE